jgi:hypothetical protein
MDTTLAFLGNYNTSLVEIGIVLVIAAAVMGLWQGFKSLRGNTEGTDATSVATVDDMRRQGSVRLEA